MIKKENTKIVKKYDKDLKLYNDMCKTMSRHRLQQQIWLIKEGKQQGKSDIEVRKELIVLIRNVKLLMERLRKRLNITDLDKWCI